MELSLGWFIWTSCYVVTLLGLSAYGIHRYSIIYLFLKNKDRKSEPPKKFDALPRVTIQLPIYNEVHVVDRLLDTVSRIEYPADRLQIQVLDDSTDETAEIAERRVRELSLKGVDIEYIRRPNRIGYKAGALEYGLISATGEFLFILDADFVPPVDILEKTIHHFTDEKVGMIQTRWGHINRSYSLLTRVQAMFLDGHLLLEQTARSRSGRFFNFNGTAGMWRRSCIESSGGWQHDTLTEDLDLSYRAQLGGWKFIFLPDVVTPAELPVDMNGFKTQQHRWTKGSIQTCKKILPYIWKSKLPFVIKAEATAHLTCNFAYLLLASLCFLLHPSSGGPDYGVTRILIFDLPIFMASSVSVAIFYMCAQRALYPDDWYKQLPLLPMLLALGIGMSLNNARAVLEAIFNHASEFTRTPKYAIEAGTQSQTWRSSRYTPLKTVLPFFEIALTVYFSFFAYYAAITGQFITLPFLILFQVGFGYVAFCSVASWLPPLQDSAENADDADDPPATAAVA
jgi:cellulose synthase/poly-beta-1,6-N-acetylglucosamine synthase-like glycosyltransferase